VDRRTRARELVIQALYQLDIQGSELLGQLGAFFRENSDDDMVLKLAEKWTGNVWNNLQQCDELIKTAAIKWEMSRLSQVDKSILRLSAYQLKFCDDIPGKVIINEAIELAKKYSSEQSASFVNGVLDAILKKIKSNSQQIENG